MNVTIPSDNRILFFGRDRAAFGFLSNFYPAPIELDGESWATVEHYYQAQKSSDPAYRAEIRNTASPARAKQLAAAPDAPRRISKRSWFRKTGTAPRPDWNEVRLNIMRRAIAAKFTQHSDLARGLLATDTAALVEDSRQDAFWGTGADGRGPNWTGRILMEVREALCPTLEARAGDTCLD
jgi:N-glycosidase YbiA